MREKIKEFFRKFIFRLRANQTTSDLIKQGLKVGSNFSRMHDVIIDPSHAWLISIGNDVTLAPRVHILAHDASTFKYLGYTKIGKVKIGNNVFIGADSVILPNVSIGDNCVIGAHSTVSRNIPSNMVAAGCPAKPICSIEDFISRNNNLMRTRPTYGEDYTLRGNISEKMKSQMIKELEDGFGYVK